jgi:hypothetical protein
MRARAARSSSSSAGAGAGAGATTDVFGAAHEEYGYGLGCAGVSGGYAGSHS